MFGLVVFGMSVRMTLLLTNWLVLSGAVVSIESSGHLLCQGRAQGSLTEGLIWFAIVMIGTGLLFVGFKVARKLLRPRSTPDATFTLSSLRDMRARGEISDAEFAKIKERILRDSLS